MPPFDDASFDVAKKVRKEVLPALGFKRASRSRFSSYGPNLEEGRIVQALPNRGVQPTPASGRR